MPSPSGASRFASCAPASPRSCSRWPRTLAATRPTGPSSGPAPAHSRRIWQRSTWLESACWSSAAGWPSPPSWPRCAAPTCSRATSRPTPSSASPRAAGARSGGRSRRCRPTCTSPRALLASGPFDLVLGADLLYDCTLATAMGALIPEIAPAALFAYAWQGSAIPLSVPLMAEGYRIAQWRPGGAGPRLFEATRPVARAGARGSRT